MAEGTAREKLINAALDLLAGHGYGATTVDRICEHAGVSKGSFYHFFKSKEDLGLAALEVYFETGTKVVMTGPFMRLEDPVERALGFLEHVESIAADHWRQGCLLGTFALNTAESHPRIRTRVAEMFEELSRGLTLLFAPFDADESGAGLTARDWAEQFQATLEGSITLARAYDDVERIPEGIRRFRKCLAGAIA